MKVMLSVRADEMRSSSSISLLIDPVLYGHAVRRINELAEELKTMHDNVEKEPQKAGIGREYNRLPPSG